MASRSISVCGDNLQTSQLRYTLATFFALTRLRCLPPHGCDIQDLGDSFPCWSHKMFDKQRQTFYVFLSSLTQYSARFVVRSLVSIWDKKSSSVILSNGVESLIIYLICLPEVRFSRYCSSKELFK